MHIYHIKFKKFFLCIFFWIFFNFASMYALHICGNYCGPNWCNGKELEEKNCDTSVFTDPEYFHVDGCCREHDACCGKGYRPSCNDALVKCISEFKEFKNNLNLEELKTIPLICGNSGKFVADFFEAMGFIEHYIYNNTGCCGTIC